MKKLLLTLGIIAIGMSSICLAGNIDQGFVSSQSQCRVSESKNVTYYLTNSITKYPGDIYRSDTNSLIAKGPNSSVQIWRRNTSILGGCTDWGRVSNFVLNTAQDPNGAKIITNVDGCIFNIPTYVKTSSTELDVQIHYTVGFAFEDSSSNSHTSGKYYHKDDGSNEPWKCYPGPAQYYGSTGYKNCSPVDLHHGQILTHTGECLNYRLYWCGDGLINGYNGSKYYSGGAYTYYEEQCDPNAPGWNSQTCNPNTCQIVQQTPPECHSQYNGKTTYTSNGNPLLNSTSPYLCAEGTQANFTGTWVFGTGRHFTWQCTAPGQTPVNCSANQIWCGDGQINSGEICEMSSSGNRGGCNTSCNLVTPTCIYNLSASPNNVTAPRTITIDGSLINPGNTPWWYYLTNLYFGDGNSTGDGRQNMSLPQTHYYTNAGTYTITGVIRNYHTPVASDIHSADRPVAYCTTTVTLTTPPATPQCSSVYSGTHYTTGNSNPWLTGGTPGLCNVGSLVNGSFQMLNTVPRHFTWQCNTQGGTPVSCEAFQTWCGDGQLNGNEECDYNDTSHEGWNGMQCDNLCHRYNPGEPVPYLVKQQKTGSMSNYTTNQVTVGGGEYITYKLVFGNSGSVTATGRVKDILPKCVKYVSSSINVPHGGWSGPTTGIVNGVQDQVLYKDIRLNAGEGGYMIVTGQVKTSGVIGINCNDIYSYLNTGYFKFDGDSDWLTSDVLAVRPQTPPTPPAQPNLTIDKEQISTGTMEAGATVAYKITVRNIGSGTATGVTIYDALPHQLQYISSSISIVPTSSYHFTTGTVNIGGHISAYILYTGITLNANGTATVYLTGKVKDGYILNTLTNCATVSGFNIAPQEDCVTVTPPTPGNPIPYMLKQQTTGSFFNANTLTTHTINVQGGDIIRYKVNFGNSGNVAATGEVWDLLPQCVDFLSSSIVFNPSNISYTGPITGTYNGRVKVTYKNFTLGPSQGGYMLIKGKINTAGACAHITSYLNTGYFTLGGITISGDVLAIRPEPEPEPYVTIVKEQISTGNLSAGSIVTYKITATNTGSGPATGVRIYDLLPKELQYLTSSIIPYTSQFATGTILTGGDYRDYVLYTGITLNANGGTAVVYLTGKVKGGYTFTTLTNCAIVSGSNIPETGDCVTSTPEPEPNVSIEKTILTNGIIHPGDLVEYKITLTNTGSAIAYNQSILDSISPSFTYQTSSIAGTTDYIFSGWEGEGGWYHISYSGFNVRPNKSVTVYLTVKLSETFNTDEISNCAVNSNGEISCVTIPIIIPDVQKYQKIGNNTGLHNGWTTDMLEVEPLQYISYRVDFGNHGNTGAYGTVKDILPQCVQYQGSSLVGVSGTPVYDASSHTVQASNIYLGPGVTGHLMVVGKILTGGDCNDVYSYLNTGAFKFDDDSDWEYSIVEAERPKGSTDVSIQKDVDMYYVKSGDVVTYTITYKNEGSTVLVNYDIVDRWPNSQLQFSGVVTPLTPAADTSNIANNIIRWEFRNQTFNPGETRVIKIQGIVR